MQHPTIFDPIPWQAVGIAALQTFVIYWLVILGLKLIGRRVFGELGPEDLIILLLIAEATDIGLAPQEAGFWGTVAAAVTILVTGRLIEQIKPLREKIEGRMVVIYEHGRPKQDQLDRFMMDEEDLKKVAREYGMPGPEAFEMMALEADGKISGVLKPEYRGTRLIAGRPSV